MSPDLVPFIHEVAVHARAAIVHVRQRKGRADLGQIDQVLLLAATGWTFLQAKKPLWLERDDA